uniref:DUF7890 domain-containing protein n=1 Tax=Leersia perrieri TaxID=77586 RepID=A0A0D9UYD0_9ORYZ
MNTKQRLYSLKLLVKTLHKMKKMMMKTSTSSSSSNKGGKKIASSKPTPEAASATAVEAAMGSNKAKVNQRIRGAQGGGQRKGVVRVKVVLTKEEAARLLSLTAGAGAAGGRKTAAQIVAEIKRMEARRAFAAAAAAWRPALESIPEEHHHSPRRSLEIQVV